MKRIILLTFTVILILGALTSCGDRKYDEAEVKAAAKELIEDSVVLNEIFWGEGIPYYEDKNTSDGVYYRAIEAYYYQLGFETVDELMELTRKTFSDNYCELIYSTIFSGIQDGSGTVTISRYYQKVSAQDGKTPEYIMVNSDWEQLLYGDVEYDYDSIKVIGSEGETVYVTVNATVTLDELEPQTREIRISLVEEKSGWRLDSPTYLTYVKSN